MANIKSAKKRINTIDRRRAENKYVKATIATYVKKFRKMLEEGKVAEAETFSKEVYAYIDSACSKGVIHKNNASRRIGRLASALYLAKTSVAPAKEEVKEEVAPVVEEKVEEKKTTRKTTTKKATTEEKPAKKTATKKEATEEKPVKKTATKKATTKKAE